MNTPNANLAAYHRRLANRDFGIGLCALFLALPTLAIVWRAIYSLCN